MLNKTMTDLHTIQQKTYTYICNPLHTHIHRHTFTQLFVVVLLYVVCTTYTHTHIHTNVLNTFLPSFLSLFAFCLSSSKIFLVLKINIKYKRKREQNMC